MNNKNDNIFIKLFPETSAEKKKIMFYYSFRKVLYSIAR